jgi:hypothetical protein
VMKYSKLTCRTLAKVAFSGATEATILSSTARIVSINARASECRLATVWLKLQGACGGNLSLLEAMSFARASRNLDNRDPKAASRDREDGLSSIAEDSTFGRPRLIYEEMCNLDEGFLDAVPSVPSYLSPVQSGTSLNSVRHIIS